MSGDLDFLTHVRLFAGLQRAGLPTHRTIEIGHRGVVMQFEVDQLDMIIAHFQVAGSGIDRIGKRIELPCRVGEVDIGVDRPVRLDAVIAKDVAFESAAEIGDHRAAGARKDSDRVAGHRRQSSDELAVGGNAGSSDHQIHL